MDNNIVFIFGCMSKFHILYCKKKSTESIFSCFIVQISIILIDKQNDKKYLVLFNERKCMNKVS